MRWFWHILGRIYEKRANYQRAAEFFEKSRSMLDLARVYENSSKYHDAMRLYADLGHLADAARLALAIGDVPAAASFYRRAGDDNRALQVLLNHGAIPDAVTLLLELGRKEEAAKVAEQHGDLRRAATICLELGQEDKAIDLLRRLNDVRGLLAIYLKRRDFRSAAEECRRSGQIPLAALLFEQAGLYAEGAKLWEEVGEWLRAAELYKKAGLFQEAGEAYEKSERLDLAVEAFTKAPNCERKAAEIYEALVRLEEHRTWEFEAPVIAMSLSPQLEAAVLALSSRRVFFTTRQFQTRWHWRPEGERVVREVAIAPTGNIILAAVDGTAANANEFFLIGLDAAKNALFTHTAEHPIRGIAFAPTAECAYVYCTGEKIRFFSNIHDEPVWEHHVDFSAWESTFSPSGNCLAVGTLGGTLSILSPKGDLLRSRQFEDRVHQIAFSFNGEFLAVAVGDRRVVICSNESLETIEETLTTETPRFLVPLQGVGESFIVAGEHCVELIRVGKGKSLLLAADNPITAVVSDPLDFNVFIGLLNKKLICYAVCDCKSLAAEWYAKAGDNAKAAELFEDVASYEKAYELYLQMGDYERAASNIQRVGDSRTAARNYEIVGKFDKAALLYEEIGDLPRAAKCYANAGSNLKAAKLFHQLGDELLAAEHFELAGDHKQAGYLFRKLEQDERAVENWEKWLAANPGDGQVAWELSQIYAGTARYNEAIKVLQSIQDDPELRRDVLRLMAECFIEKGLYEVAADRLLEALGPEWKAQRDNLELVYDLAIAFERAGRLEEAKELYSKILAVDYYYRDVVQKLERTRQRITQARAETQLAAVGMSSEAADPFGATMTTKATKESLRYKIVRKLGQGGMGVVYLALDTRLGRYVAWKVLPAHLAGDPEFQRRLLQEACAIAQVVHPNIVAVYDVVTNPNECFLTMEYVDGASLRLLLSREKTLPLSQALRYTKQMASALAAAHQAQIIHRDVKPENVMITSATDEVKMVDFGLARLAEDAKVTREGCVVGTVSYMAPEQIRGQAIDGRVDLYALGVVLFEMLVGRPPFVGDNILAQHLHVPPPSLAELVPDVPQSVCKFVERCLEKNPDDRFASALEALHELQRLEAEAKELSG
ncbi:MAG: protein kinase [Candidatus Sumerlaeaceae bacterium]|nr:protein kinase [Candidatus Sumerlaeaceae bacterium]